MENATRRGFGDDDRDSQGLKLRQIKLCGMKASALSAGVVQAISEKTISGDVAVPSTVVEKPNPCKVCASKQPLSANFVLFGKAKYPAQIPRTAYSMNTFFKCDFFNTLLFLFQGLESQVKHDALATFSRLALMCFKGSQPLHDSTQGTCKLCPF